MQHSAQTGSVVENILPFKNLPSTASNPTRILSPGKTLAHPTNRKYNTFITPSFDFTFDESRNQECLLKRDDYSVRLVSTHKQRVKTNKLIERMYASRGYCTESTTASSPNLNLNQITLEASNEQHLFGTLTLTIDSSNKGLLADELYQQEINTFRKKNGPVCEVSKLAFDPDYSSKEVFASLFHLAYIYACSIHDTKDAFIEINPRHAPFYKRMLGFSQVGEKRTCKRVNAPAILLHLNLGQMGAKINSLAGSCKSIERSIYPYFLTELDKKRVTKKLGDYNASLQRSSKPTIKVGQNMACL